MMDQEKRLRREIANSNERRRMQSINSGFNSLRSLLPHMDGEKLSKAAILQHAADLIQQIQEEKARLYEQNIHFKRVLTSIKNGAPPTVALQSLTDEELVETAPTLYVPTVKKFRSSSNLTTNSTTTAINVASSGNRTDANNTTTSNATNGNNDLNNTNNTTTTTTTNNTTTKRSANASNTSSSTGGANTRAGGTRRNNKNNQATITSDANNRAATNNTDNNQCSSAAVGSDVNNDNLSSRTNMSIPMDHCKKSNSPPPHSHQQQQQQQQQQPPQTQQQQQQGATTNTDNNHGTSVDTSQCTATIITDANESIPGKAAIALPLDVSFITENVIVIEQGEKTVSPSHSQQAASRQNLDSIFEAIKHLEGEGLFKA